MSKGHVHHLKNDVQTPVLVFDALSLHNVRTVGTLAFLVDFVEALEDLDFSLLKSLLFGLKLVLESLYGIDFARLNMSALVDMPETAATNQLFLLKFVEENHFPFG